MVSNGGFRWRRAASIAASLVLLPTLAVAVAAAPAQANPSECCITGNSNGILTQDWAGEGELSRWSYSHSKATQLWQAVLWADDAIESNGTTFDLSDIDCEFGPNTEAATRNWQGTHSVGVDGEVGPQTFGRADDNLVWHQWDESDHWWVLYQGSHHTLRFYRSGAAFNHIYATNQDGFYFSYHGKGASCGGDPSWW